MANPTSEKEFRYQDPRKPRSFMYLGRKGKVETGEVKGAWIDTATGEIKLIEGRTHSDGETFRDTFGVHDCDLVIEDEAYSRGLEKLSGAELAMEVVMGIQENPHLSAEEKSERIDQLLQALTHPPVQSYIDIPGAGPERRQKLLLRD